MNVEALAEPHLAGSDDVVYLPTARAGNADLIVSGDRHLLSLEVWEGIPVVSPREFAALLAGGEITEPAPRSRRGSVTAAAKRLKASATPPPPRRRAG